MKQLRRGVLVSFALTLCLVWAQSVSAARFTSTSYVIDASVNDSFGGQSSSSSYEVVGTGGESIVGNGAGGSYKIGAGYAAQLQQSFRMSVQPEGLMALYPLDETVLPTIFDNSVNTVNGTAVGSPSSTTGKLDGALSFNGSSQYVQLGSTSSLQGTTLTLGAWVKTSTSSGLMAAVSKGNSFLLGVNDGYAAIYDWTGASVCASTTPSVADGSWHHIAATLDSGTTDGSVIYVDGIEQKTCTWTPVNQTGQPAIGASSTGSWANYFNGQIDNVKVFDRVLTADEVKAEYQGQNAGNASGVSLGDIVPGISNTVNYDVIVRTDAGGYSLAVNQDQNLTSGGNTIPAVGGTIASPAAWNEGTTKGLGFSLYATNATAIPGKWNSGDSYAAFPGTATTFYTRTGYSGGASDYISLRMRLDVATSQLTGDYTNTITTTGTITP